MMRCISHYFQFIHGKEFHTYYQCEGCPRGRQLLQRSYIFHGVHIFHATDCVLTNA